MAHGETFVNGHGLGGVNRLRRYVADRENRAQGFERIVLEAVVTGAVPSGPWDRGGVRKVAFWGR